MDCDRFLEELQSRLGGETRQEELVLGSAPRLYTHYQGFFVKFDFVTTAEIIIDVNTPPPHRLRVRKEGWLSRAADSVPLLADHKTGDEAFDREYEIDNATSEQVLRFFTDEVRSLIRSLEPFVSFELTHKEYRCFKVLESSEEYTPAKAHADIDALIRIARIAEQLPKSGDDVDR